MKSPSPMKFLKSNWPLIGATIVILALVLIVIVLPAGKGKRVVNNDYYSLTRGLEKKGGSKPDEEMSGIVSFEMYVPQEKKRNVLADISSRTRSVVSIVADVTGVADDLTAKNIVISRVLTLGFKLQGGELLTILKAAAINDDFHYFNAIKSVAPNLEYPLNDSEMQRILDAFSDSNYKFKTKTVLSRESARQR